MELIGDENDQWPIVKHLDTMYLHKIDIAVMISILGHGGAAGADAYIFERIGGEWHTVPTDSSSAEYTAALHDAIHTSTSTDERFDKIIHRFIEPDALRAHSAAATEFSELFKAFERADVVKIDCDEEKTRLAVYQMLDAGLRPALVMARFPKSPDESVPAMLCAGHLQNCGYILLAIHEDKYLYYFTNDCVYEYAHWAEPAPQNPLVLEITAASRGDAPTIPASTSSQ